MIYQYKPEDFDARFEIASCFVEYGGKILLLHRQDHKPEGNFWCMPGGKIEKSEKISQAAKREVYEESRLDFPENKFKYFGKVYVRYPNYDFIYHIFHLQLNKEEKIKVDKNEHKDFCWVLPENALEMPLIQDLDNCIKLYYKI